MHCTNGYNESMTSVVDGVRREPLGVKVAQPSASGSRPRAAGVKKINAHSSKANLGVRYITGMDGIRRQAPVSPREVLRNIQTLPKVAPVPATVAEVAVANFPRPALTLPKLRWRAPLAGLAMVVAVVLATEAFLVPAINANKVNAASVTPKTVQNSPAKTPAPAVAPQDQKQLDQILSNFVAPYPNEWSIVVKDLKTGETATYEPTRVMDSASLYKLFVADHIYQLIDLGKLSYADQAGNGTGLTVQGCLQLMITVSSNPCGEALGGILGWGDQNQSLLSEGYTGTNLATLQQTDSQDVALLLQRLYNGTLLTPNSTNAFMTLLKDQQINNRLPQGLPAGTVIAHKTGDLYGYAHDAGIVYGPKTDYLVVVMSGSWDAPGNAPPMFANLSQQLWNYFEN